MIRAIYAFIVQGFRQQGAYRVEGWMGMLSSLIWFVLFAGIWTALLQDNPEALQRQMQYVVATRFLAELMLLPTWEVTGKFRQGDIGLELIKPVALPLRILGEFFGRAVFRLLRSLPIFVVIWIAFRLPAPKLSAVLLFIVSALLGWMITATLQLSLTLIALWTVQFDEAETIFSTLQSVFSGNLIPLHYLPPAIGAVAMFLPFAGVVYVPSAILSGTLEGASLVQGMGLQIIWTLVGAAILTVMWRAGSRKLVVQGG